jgi:predicted phosphodiesterase
LEAVLADLDESHVADYVVVGDLVAGGPAPNAVVETLRRRGASAVASAGDQTIARAPGDSADGGRQVDGPSRQWLAGLPREERILFQRRSFLVGHRAQERPDGGQTSSPEGVDIETAPDVALRKTLRHVLADVLIQAGSHRVSIRETRAGLVADPGSVGFSFDGPFATYLIFEEGSLRERRVSFPIEEVRTAITARPVLSEPEKAMLRSAWPAVQEDANGA